MYLISTKIFVVQSRHGRLHGNIFDQISWQEWEKKRKYLSYKWVFNENSITVQLGRSAGRKFFQKVPLTRSILFTRRESMIPLILKICSLCLSILKLADNSSLRLYESRRFWNIYKRRDNAKQYHFSQRNTNLKYIYIFFGMF